MSWSLIHADVLEGLASLRDGSAHAAVTSPPYWGLRDYHGVPETDWPSGWRGKLGLEPTVELYVEHLVEILREVRRVLREDGTLWLNLGDKFGDDSKWGGATGGKHAAGTHGRTGIGRLKVRTGLAPGNLLGIPWRVATRLQEDGWVLRSTIIWHKPCPMPESLTGWRWERCRVKTVPATYSDRDPTGGLDDPIKQQGANGIGDPTNNAQWADCPGCPKCEPDSCPCPLCREQDVQKSRGLIVKALGRTAVAAELCARAIAYQFGGAAECPICGGSGSYGGLVLRRGRWRPTTAHEYLFLLAPGGGTYFADGEAVRERSKRQASGNTTRVLSGRNGHRPDDHLGSSVPWEGDTRNPRSVWTIGPEPYSGEHYAAFPAELPRRCIRAATPQAACAECGAPHAPVVDSHRTLDGVPIDGAPGYGAGDLRGTAKPQGVGHWRFARESKVLGYRPTCRCEAESTPALVLDPFAGTGTTGVAALQLGRRFVGIELSAQYLGLARERLGAACVETILQRPARVRVPEGPLFDNLRR